MPITSFVTEDIPRFKFKCRNCIIRESPSFKLGMVASVAVKSLAISTAASSSASAYNPSRNRVLYAAQTDWHGPLVANDPTRQNLANTHFGAFCLGEP